jgi:hypothetical protein
MVVISVLTSGGEYRRSTIGSTIPDRRNNIGSHARFPLAEALKTMNVDRLNELEMIDPRPLPPWRSEAFAEINVEPDRETARENAEAIGSRSDIIVYSDASGTEGHLGASVVALDGNQRVVESRQIQVGPMNRWSVHVSGSGRIYMYIIRYTWLL